eukprot:Awhi_evm1s10313
MSTTVEDFNILTDRVDAFAVNVNQLFLLLMGLFVLMMQLGFAFLEAGSVRTKNTTNILLKNFGDPVLATLSYWAFGYAFAYGSSSNAFIGHAEFFLSGNDYIDYSFWFFQMVFAATAATIVSGAVAERCTFPAYVTYSIVLTGIIYPIGSHWAWSSTGWLATNGPGFKDFAGSSVVHVVGGTSALVAAIALGPRIGRFIDGKDTPIPGHSVAFTALGGMILWAGFFAFNGGSQLSITEPGDGDAVALAFANTALSGAASSIVALVIKFFMDGHYFSLLTAINGLLAGMVAICAGCNAVEPYGAFIIGLVAGAVYMGCSWLLVKFRIDDPLDASPVHLGCGAWGTLAAVIFANGSRPGGYDGIFYSGSSDAWEQLGWNLLGLVVYFFWSLICSIIMYGSLKLAGLLRVTEAQERAGMDEKKHGEPAYPELLEMSKMSFKPNEQTIQETPSPSEKHIATGNQADANTAIDVN